MSHRRFLAIVLAFEIAMVLIEIGKAAIGQGRVSSFVVTLLCMTYVMWQWHEERSES